MDCAEGVNEETREDETIANFFKRSTQSREKSFPSFAGRFRFIGQKDETDY